MKTNTIFVQLASYRDPELVNTLRSLFSTAKHPNSLKVGLAWQKDEKESLEEFNNDPRVTVLEIPFDQAKGVCWARNLLQYLYRGEKYTLQIDSHHRFIKNWDVVLVEMIEDLMKDGYKKPLITSYLPSFNPLSEEKDNTPYKLTLQQFLPDGPALPQPEHIKNFKNLKKPIKANFYSAHFAFTLGQFCKEVPHDPEIYFHGEEPSIGVRAFTWGYDLFHPHRVIGWHEYSRESKPKHWDDNEWVNFDKKSFLRYRKLFSVEGEKYSEEEFGRFGFGKERTLEEFKIHSGLDFTNKTLYFDNSKKKTNLYILTFNFPQQLEYIIKEMRLTPEWLLKPNLFLLDNSTNSKARRKNKEIAIKNGFEYISLGKNTGICRGRQFAAEHFDNSDADFMFFFEDDMILNSSEYEGDFCRKGFRRFIPDLYNIVHKIMVKEDFDFLKLSFSEVHWDNNIQTSWYNVPQEVRSEIWPEYDTLPDILPDPNAPRTLFERIDSLDNLSYITGEVYYSNWPMIVSKEGNKKIFINKKWKNPYEQQWMSHVFQETVKENIKPAVLLASPIWHERIANYKFEKRKEN